MNEKVQDVIIRKAKRGIDVKKMDFLGSYKICIDTKRDIQELIGDICGKQHDRFRDELVLAQNNGIKGNDSVTIESGNISVTAKNGNGIKTENTHVSDKGNQKGYVTIKGGVLDINSADDPIDAAYDLILDSQNAKVTTNK